MQLYGKEPHNNVIKVLKNNTGKFFNTVVHYSQCEKLRCKNAMIQKYGNTCEKML